MGTKDEGYGGRWMVKEGEGAEINIHKTARKGRGRETAPLSFISRVTVIILSPPASPLQLRSAKNTNKNNRHRRLEGSKQWRREREILIASNRKLCHRNTTQTDEVISNTTAAQNVLFWFFFLSPPCAAAEIQNSQAVGLRASGVVRGKHTQDRRV